MPAESTPNLVDRRHFLKQAGVATAATALLAGLPSFAQDAGPIMVALVGAAHIHTPGYVKILQSRSDVKVKCVWDHDAARAAHWAGELGVPAVDDVKKIWDDK